MKNILIFAITFCSVPAQAKESLFIGIWCSHHEADATCSSIEEFYEDGTYYSHGIVKEANVRYESRGEWAYINGKGCITPKERKYFNSITNELIEVDSKVKPYCNPVLELDKDKMVIELSGGQILTLPRIKEQ